MRFAPSTCTRSPSAFTCHRLYEWLGSKKDDQKVHKCLAPNRNVWKRFKPIIPNVGCLHGKWGNTAWHIHVNLRVSERVDDETLLHGIYLTALKEPWIPNGPDYVNLSPIRSGGGAIGCPLLAEQSDCRRRNQENQSALNSDHFHDTCGVNGHIVIFEAQCLKGIDLERSRE